MRQHAPGSVSPTGDWMARGSASGAAPLPRTLPGPSFSNASALLHRVCRPFSEYLAAAGRGLLTDRYLHHYRRFSGIQPTFERWRFVHWATRFAEEIPEEHPALLRLLDRAALALSRQV